MVILQHYAWKGQTAVTTNWDISFRYKSVKMVITNRSSPHYYKLGQGHYRFITNWVITTNRYAADVIGDIHLLRAKAMTNFK